MNKELARYESQDSAYSHQQAQAVMNAGGVSRWNGQGRTHRVSSYMGQQLNGGLCVDRRAGNS